MTTDPEQMAVQDQKSLALKIKARIGHRAWRLVTRPISWGLRIIPSGILYRLGLAARKNSYPYSVLSEGDIALQVGAPCDLLKAGRSRAVYFAMMVGKTGRVFIFEPEPENAREMEAFLERFGLSDRAKVIAKGCWFENRVLKFWSNPEHPASNLLEDVSKWSEGELRKKGYQPSEVSVTTIDEVVMAEGLGRIKLLSVTTNGSEEQILEGAKSTLAATEFLALADTGPEIHALSQNYGFRNVALDDRGFTSVRNQQPG